MRELKLGPNIKVSIGFALVLSTIMGSMCFVPGLLHGLSLELYGLACTLLVIAIVLLLNNARFRGLLHIELIVVSCSVVLLLILGFQQYFHFFIWEQQCRRGNSEACWMLALEHRAERDFGMRKSKAVYYQSRACQLRHPLACEAEHETVHE